MITPRVIVFTIKYLDKYNMSSILRSLQTPAGYFVMSADTVLDGSGYGIYTVSAEEVVANSGLVTTPAKLKMTTVVKDEIFDGNSGTGTSVTLKDLGKTLYGAELHDVGGNSQGISDVRKVSITSGPSAGANLSTGYYVPLGTDLRNSTGENHVSTTINPSVALVGKLL
jgi:hypothetical protein